MSDPFGGRRGGSALPRSAGALLGVLGTTLFALLSIPLLGQSEIGSGQLRILGAALDASPEAQTVPVGIPTQVSTTLQVAAGSLSASIVVRADLTGPGILGSLALATVPNAAFPIPAQTVRGVYTLSNIRLEDSGRIVAYSAHRDVTITVADVLLAQVTSRPLTYQEMIDKGIVVSSRNFRAYSFVFAIEVQSRLQQFEIPIVFPEFGPPILPSIPRSDGQAPVPEWFTPPQVRAVQWGCPDLVADASRGLAEVYSTGGEIELPCGLVVQSGQPDSGAGGPDTRPLLLSLLLIPGDVAFLNQFFSLSVIVQNGAPSGSNLKLESLTAKASLPPALRAAETNPPTNLADPVAIVDPGPDGKLGTADDVTFLLAQSVGKAEFLVEGLQPGRWDVPIDLTATLTGLPGGPVNLRGKTTGSVLVRNPSFFVTLDHPDVIRTGETYTISATVTNTSGVPANQVSVQLDKAFLTGADLLSAETVALGNIAPGDTALAKFSLSALRTGRVTADAFFGTGSLAGSVVLHAGIGELSIPLSPDTLVFPRDVDQVPASLADPARRLLGLAWSIAKSPDANSPAGLSPIGEQAARWRIDDLVLAARHKSLGEADSTAWTDWMLGWLNAGSNASVAFDQLRRASAKGGELASAWGQQLTQFFQAETPFAYQKRVSAALPDKAFLSAVLSSGNDPANPSARLVIAGKTVPGRAQLFSGESGYERSLPSAELYRAAASGTQYEIGLVGSPVAGGYRIQIAGKRADNVTLTLSYPGAAGKFVFVSFGPFVVSAGTVAFVDIVPGIDPTQLALTGASATGTIQLSARSRLTLMTATQDLAADPRGHAISLLFNRSLAAGDPAGDVSKYQVRSSYGVNTTRVAIPQPQDGRLVILGVANQPSPYTTSTVQVTRLTDAAGSAQSPDPQIVNLDVRDRTPGGSVDGTVIGSGGQPIAGATVLLKLPQVSDTTGQTFLDDFASVTADGAGKFFFEYVQVRQGSVFQILAADPVSGYDGDAYGQILTEAQRITVNVVLLGRGDVEGRVLDEAGAPVPNAYVTAESVFYKGAQNRGSTNAAADGSFRFKALPVGAVQLWAIDAATRKSAFQVASIPSAGGKATQNIVIVRSPRAGVSGDVIHERSGSPAVGLYVVAYGDNVAVSYGSGTDRKYFGFRVTDANGRFSFADVAPGADLLQVYDFSRSTAPVLEYTLQVLANTETVLHLVELDPQTKYGSIAGTVRLNTSGTLTPLANALISVSDSPVRALTDSTGHYRLNGVPVGSRIVAALSPPPQTKQTQTATVQESLVTSLDFTFTAVITGPRAVSGLVLDPLDRPVAGAGVAEFDSSGNVLRSAVADSSGHYSLAGVPPGIHNFFALGRDDTSGAMRDDVGSASINLDGTADVTLTIRLAGVGTVQGTVLGSHLSDAGFPVDSPVIARVTLAAGRLVKIGQFGFIAAPGSPLYLGDAATDSSGSDGSYAFPNVVSGPYSIVAHHPVYGDKTGSGAVSAGQSSIQNFHYDNALSWIDGFLYDERGSPVAGANVDLWQGSAPAVRDNPANLPYATVATISDPADPRGLGYFRFITLPNRSFTLAFNGVLRGIQRYDQAFITVGGNPHAIRVTLRARAVQDVRVLVQQPDSNNALQPVAGASVSLVETDWPHRSFRLDTGNDGRGVFPGVSEGRFTINAQRLGQAGTAGQCVCVEGGTVDVAVLLPGTGSVRGTVRFPGTGAAVASAQVLLLDNGNPVGAAQTDAGGQYRIDGVSLQRILRIRVKDNGSARYGFAADLVLNTAGEIQTRDAGLLALGSVSGSFTKGPGLGVAGATVELTSDSVLGRTKFYSGTDGQGQFVFSGIPQGVYTLASQDPVTKLSGTNAGQIDSEAQVAVTNLKAQASGTLDVTVQDSAGGSLALPPIVTVSAPGVPPRTVISSQFRLSDVPLGTFSIAAEEQSSSSKHRAVGSGRLTADGETQSVVLRYVPYGNVNVRVIRVATDGSESPANRGRVMISGKPPYAGQFPFGSWVNVDASTGIASFVSVGGGDIDVLYYDTLTGRGTSATAALTVEGASVTVEVRALDTSSSISGRLLKPAPFASQPSVGAFVTLGSQTFVTDSAGRFSFPNVPFGTYILTFQSTPDNGRAVATASLSAASAPLDIGDVVLDGQAPAVVSVGPPNGTVGVPRAATVVVQFSEPVQVRQAGSFMALGPDHSRTGSVSLSADRRTANWTASPPLLPGTAYRFLVRTDAVADDAGWVLASGFTSTFTTIDDSGPGVIQVAPPPDSIQVPVSSTVVVVFDSALDANSIRPGTVVLEKTRPASALVAGAVSAGSTSTSVVFTPNVPLDQESAYRVTVSGLKDTAGNAMYVPYLFSFATLDNVSPAITFDAPPAPSFYTNSFYKLGLSWTSNDIRSIQIKVNGYDGPMLFTSAADRAATFTDFVGDSTSPRVYAATPVDLSGNIGSVARLSVPVVVDALPTVSIQVTSPTSLSPGGTLTGRVTGSDDRGLQQLRLEVQGPFFAYLSWTVSGIGATQNFSIPVPVTAGAGGVVTLTATAVDNSGGTYPQYGTAVDKSVSIVRDTIAPTISNLSPASGSSVVPGAQVSISADIADNLGLQTVRLSGAASGYCPTPSGTRFTCSFQAPKGSSDFTMTLTASDYAGNMASLPMLFHLLADSPPTGSIAITPTGTVLPNNRFTATITANDDHGLQSVALRTVPPCSFQGGSSVSGTSTIQGFLVTVPLGAAAGSTIAVSADVTDVSGHTITLGPNNVIVAADTTPPTLSGASPANGATVVSGQPMTVSIVASDDVAISSVDIVVDGLTTTKSPPYGYEKSSGYSITYLAKPVSTATAVPIHFAARDGAGHVTTLDQTLNVTPNTNTTPPTISITCPTAGALFPPGYTLTVSAAAGDDQGIQRVEFYANGSATPFATTSASPFTGAYTVPTGLANGTNITLRARAYDWASNFADRQVIVQVATGISLTSDTVIPFGDTSKDGQTVIVTGGTTQIEGPHSFARLVVLSGARVTQAPTTLDSETSLQLNVSTGVVYVGCGGAIDVSGKGYWEGRTLGNLPIAGPPQSGGSYGGTGVSWGGTPPATYGSFSNPIEPGSGSNTNNFGGTPHGGGVVRLAAQTLIDDGTILSDGTAFCSGYPTVYCDAGGAGGAIRLDLQTLSGSGSIEAAGTGNPSGGGGRIAIRYTNMSGFDRSRLHAAGFGGGSGTTFLKSAAQTYGELLLDRMGSTVTDVLLPAIGTGTITGVSGSTITDGLRVFPSSVVGLYVEVRRSGTVVGLYQVTAQSAGTLTVTPAPTAVHVADTYQGILRLDSLTIRGARLVTADVIRSPILQLQGGASIGGSYDPPSELFLDGNSFTASGPLTVSKLSLSNGAVLTTAPSTATATTRLDLTVSGTLTIDANSRIDVSAKGYLGGQAPGNPIDQGLTYGNVPGSGRDAGGSYGGRGMNYLSGISAATYGSFYDPNEPGGGGGASGTGPGGSGGGVARIQASTIQLDGTIAANGSGGGAGGAGGAIRIDVGTLAGAGSIFASSYGSGGGGRIALYYTNISGFDTTRIVARSGSGALSGAGGTIYLKGSSQTLGDLVVYTHWVPVPVATELPSVGAGTLTAVLGATFTDSSRTFPISVAGLFVEVRRSGSVIGTYKVISQSAGTLTLDQAVQGTVQVGDRYQGVVRLNNLKDNDGGRLSTDDILEASTFSVTGLFPSWIRSPLVRGTLFDLGSGRFSSSAPLSFMTATIHDAATLTHEPATLTSTSLLDLTTTGALTIDSTSQIDVTGQGYLGGLVAGNSIAGRTLGNTAGSGQGSGGSFGGSGGQQSYVAAAPVAATFGSLFDPRDTGGGGGSDRYGRAGGSGGGFVRVNAGTLQLDGAIVADGGYAYGGGGGSGGGIRIDAGTLAGAGRISAAGGIGYSAGSGGTFALGGSGGGGRVGIFYTTLSGFDLTRVSAPSGQTTSSVSWPAAGTILLKSATQSFGNLILDNGGTPGAVTVLPAIGSGTLTAVAGSIITDSSKTFPYSVVGISVEIRRVGTLIGTYRVVGQTGPTLTLDQVVQGTVLAGDTYKGMLHLDGLTITNGARVSTSDLDSSIAVSVNPLSVTAGQSASATVTLGNAAPPGGALVTLTSSNPAIAAMPASVTVPAGSTSGTATVRTFAVPSTTAVALSGTYSGITGIATLTVNPGALSSLNLSPTTIVGGNGVSGTITMTGLPTPGGAVVALSSSDASVVTVPATATVPAGSTSVPFSVTTLVVSVPKAVTITGVYSGVTKTASLTVNPLAPAIASVTVSPSTVTGGMPSTGTVTLSSAAYPGGALVTLSSSNTAVATVPANITVASGATTATFAINTQTVVSSTNVTISAISTGAAKTAVLTVTPCASAAIPPPSSFPGGDVVWTDDQEPAGSTTYLGWTWDTSQKASGTRSHTDGVAAGEHHHGFDNAWADNLYVGASDKVFTYVLLDPCNPPKEVLLSFDVGGMSRFAFWGSDLIGWGTLDVERFAMGALPATGQWVRLEVPVGALGMSDRTVGNVGFAVYDGRAWFDRSGKNPSCSVAVASTPIADPVETIWVDDQVPPGTTSYGEWRWNTTQKASGTQSHEESSVPNEHHHGFQNAWSLNWYVEATDKLVAWVLVDPCDPPQEILLQWDGGGFSPRAFWGADLIAWGTLGVDRFYAGPIPAAGGWVRLEVPASMLGLGGRIIGEIAFAQFGGHVWWDRVGKLATCSVAAVPAPASFPGGDVVWSDDAIPAAATTNGTWVWDTTQKASGTRSHTEPSATWIHDHSWDGANPAFSVASGDKLVVYALINRCDPPREIMLQWHAFDGWEHRAFWGADLIDWGAPGTAGRVNMGVLPATGQWVRLEVPASSVGLAGQSVFGMDFALVDGQVWWDRAGKGTVATPTIASLTLSPTTIPAAGTSTGTITLSAAAPTGGAVVALSSADTSVATVPTSVTIAAGTLSKTFTATAQSPTVNSSATISATYGNTITAVLNVSAAAPGALSSFSCNPSAVVGGNLTTCTVALTSAAPAGGATVTLSSPDISVPSSITVAAGATSASFTLTTPVVTTTTILTITATYGGVSKTATITVAPAAALVSLAVSPSSVPAGTSATGTPTLSAGAPSGGVVVSLSSSNTAAATVPSTVNIVAGASSATFPIMTLSVATDITVTISATYLGITKTAILTVLATGLPPGELTENNASSWSPFASDSAVTSVTDDSLNVKAGAASIKFVTASGFDTGVRYPASPTAHWDLTGKTFLSFWVYGVNTNAGGWQGYQPIVALKTATGDIQYAPTLEMIGTGSWKLCQIALTGDSFWERTDTGSPTLSDVHQIEIHQDTWGAGFTVYYDGMRFLSALPGEMTEGNAAQWGAFAADSAAASVADDTTFVKVGAKSIKFVTASGIDTGVVYPAAGNAHWNLADKDFLSFWIYAQNTNAGGFQGDQPLVVLKTSAGDITYTAQGTLMTIDGWRLYQVSLAGAPPWTATVPGGYDLSDVNQLEIHHDTWGGGFTLYYDGLSFESFGVLPTVTISSPASGATFTAPANVLLTATASDSDGTIAKVEYFQGATKLGEATASPFSVTWTAVPTGSYTLYARATDSSGESTRSSPVSITVSNAVAALASVALSPTNVAGGNPSTGTVTLTLAAPTGGAVVTLSSSNTASATVPASVTVSSGATTATFTVTTLGVAATATPTISATYAGVTKTAALTVTPAALSAVTVSPASVIGGVSSTGTVTLTGKAPTGGALVTLSSSNTAAATVPASVTVPAGATSATFTATTSSVASSTAVTVSAVYLGVTKTATLTVTPAAAALSAVSLAPSSVVGGNPSTGTVTLTAAAPSGGVTVTLTSSLTSAATVPASVTIAAGATSATFTATTVGVSTSTAVTISAIYSGVTKTAGLTVTPAVLVSVSLAPTGVAGGNPSTATITLNGKAPTGGAAVTLSSSNSAVATVPASATVVAGATTATFTVTTLGVPTSTAVTVSTTYSGLTKTATLTVTPAALSTVALAPGSVAGGVNSTGTVTLTGKAPAGGAVVSLASSATTFATVPAGVTVAGGAMTATFTVTTLPVAAATSATISGAYAGLTKTAILTVTPAVLTSVTLSPTTVAGGVNSTGTVTLAGKAVAGGAVVTLSSSATASATVPASVTVAAGASTATFSVTTLGVVSATPVTVSAVYAGVTKTAILTVNPAALSGLSLAPPAVVGGSANTVGTVTLTGKAPPVGVVVALSSSNAAVATVPASVTVAAGATTATFTVTSLAVAASTSVNVSAGYSGVTKTAALTVTPPGALSAVSIAPATVAGGVNAAGTVTLTFGAPSGGAVVALSSSDTTAATVPASVTVAAGATSATFTLTTLGVAATKTPTISGTYSSVTRTASLSVTPAVLANETLSPTSVVGGVNSTGTVTFTGKAPPGGAVVALSSSSTAVATVPATVTVASGASSATFTVTTLGVASSSTATISATYAGITKNATLTTTAAALLALTIAPASIVGGDPATGTLTLTGKAPPAGAAVTLSSSVAAAATVPPTVVIPANVSRVNFTVTTSGVTSSTPVTVTAVYAGVTKTAALTVAPAVLSALSLAPPTVLGGDLAIANVLLDGQAPSSGITVALSSSDATAATVPASVSIAAGARAATFSVTSLPIASPRAVTISATYASATRTAALEVREFNPDGPLVAMTCPSDGALHPVGRSLTVSATVTGTAAISKVEFYLDAAATPFFTDTASPYSTTYTVPAGLPDGTVFVLRARAYDAAGRTGEAQSVVTVVSGDLLTANTTIGPSDVSHENRTLIVAAGTTTIQGLHAFARLVVLSGAKVTQAAATPTTADALWLSIYGGPTYVACGGSIDVSGKGYLGGNSGGNAALTGQTLGNSAGSAQGAGGSDGGLGGDYSPAQLAGSAFGSPFDPRDGGGGGGELTGAGGTGGGALALVAGQLIVDGTILADGTRGADTGGAGGSVRIDASALSGSGTIRAAGASALTAAGGSGGGGRIAVRYGTLAGFDRTKVSAAGGSTGKKGGAGTVYLKSDAQTYGDLVVDNLASDGAATPMASVGTATIASASGNTITVTGTTFSYSLAGLWLVVNNDSAHPYGILSNTANTITTAFNPANPALSTLVGLPFAGVMKLDSLTVRGKGKLVFPDRIETPAIDVDTAGGSSLAPGALAAPTLVSGSTVGGAPVSGSVKLTAPAPTGGTIVTLTSSSPTTASVPASVAVPAGSTAAPFTVSTTTVASTTTVTISATLSSVTRPTTLVVTPGAAAASLSLAPTTVVGGNPSTGTVVLNGPAPTGGVAVALSSSNTGVATVPASVTVAAGSSSLTFTVTTVGVTAATPVTISANAGGISKSAVLAVTRAVLSTVTLAPASVVGGVSGTGTVTLTGKAPAGGAAITLTSSNTMAATVPASVTIAAGAKTVTFTVTTTPVAANATSVVTATYSGVSKTATQTATAPAAASLTLSPTTVKGGSVNSTATVTLTGSAPAAGMVVTLASANTAAATVPATVTIAAGNTAGTFTVTTLPVAANATFNISATCNGVTKTAALTVTP